MVDEIGNENIRDGQGRINPVMLDKFSDALAKYTDGEMPSLIASKVIEASEELAEQTKNGPKVAAGTVTKTKTEIEENSVEVKPTPKDVETEIEETFQKIVKRQGRGGEKENVTGKGKSDIVKGGARNNKYAKTAEVSDVDSSDISVQVSERKRVVPHTHSKTVEKAVKTEDKIQGADLHEEKSAISTQSENNTRREFFLSTINKAQDEASLKKALESAIKEKLPQDAELINAVAEKLRSIREDTVEKPEKSGETDSDKEKFINKQLGILREEYKKRGFGGLLQALGREKFLKGTFEKGKFIPSKDNDKHLIWNNIKNAEEVREAVSKLQKELDKKEKTNNSKKAAKEKKELDYNNVNKGDNIGGERPSPVLDENQQAQAAESDKKSAMRSVSEWTQGELEEAAAKTNMSVDEVRDQIKSRNQFSGYMKSEGAEIDEKDNLNIENISDNFIDRAKNQMEKEAASRQVNEIVRNQERNDPLSPDFVSPEFNPDGLLDKDEKLEARSVESINKEISDLIDRIGQVDHSTPEGAGQQKDLKEQILSLMNIVQGRAAGEEEAKGETANKKGAEDISDPNYVFDPESVGKTENIESRSNEDISHEVAFLINQDSMLDLNASGGAEQHREFNERISFLQNILDKRAAGGNNNEVVIPDSPEDIIMGGERDAIPPPIIPPERGGGGGGEGGGENSEDGEGENNEVVASESTEQGKREILAQAEYQDLIDARTPYLKALAGKRKWFRRTSSEEVAALRNGYEKAVITFVSKEAQKMIESQRPGLEGTEKEMAILELASTLMVNEFLDRSNNEADLANETTGKKIQNWLRRHSKTKLLIGGALAVGAIATGGTGAGIALLGARALWGGANAAIATEGGLDAVYGYLSGKYGERGELSPEDVKTLSNFGINEKLALHLARSTRRGEKVSDGDRDETVSNLLTERERDLKAAIEKMTEEGKSPDQIRKELLEESLKETNLEIEKGQDKERTRSIKRWIVAGAVGLIIGGWIAKAGLDRMGASESAPNHTGTGGTPHEAAPAAPAPVESAPIPTQTELMNNFSVTEVAGRGDGEWHLATRALRGFTDKFGIGLDSRQQTIAIDWMKDRLIVLNEGQIVPSPSHWINIGHSHEFKGEFIKQAIEYAKAH